jgi:hypothetical protein
MQDPFETGQEIVLQPGLTASEFAAMFDPFAQLEIVLTHDEAVFVFARLVGPPQKPPQQVPNKRLLKYWDGQLIYYDAACRRIGVQMWLLQALNVDDVEFCMQFPVSDPEIRNELRAMAHESVTKTNTQHFRPKTLAHVYRHSLRAALQAWCASPPGGPGGLGTQGLCVPDILSRVQQIPAPGVPNPCWRIRYGQEFR